jgi:hypothetical protein
METLTPQVAGPHRVGVLHLHRVGEATYLHGSARTD